MAEELKIMQKVFDMMQYGYGALAQYPKSEKFALCTDIKRCMFYRGRGQQALYLF